MMPGTVLSTILSGCGSIPALVIPAAALSLLKILQETTSVSHASEIPQIPPATENDPNARGSESAFHRLVDRISRPTVPSLAAFAAVAGLALITGTVVLFIDLPLPVMGILSLVSLSLLALAAPALVCRAFGGVRLPKPLPSPSAGTGPDPAGPGIEESPGSGPSGETGRLLPYLPADPSPSVISQYWVSEPFAYVTIAQEGVERFRYTVTEPALTGKEMIVLQETYARLRDLVIYDTSEKDRERKFQPEFVNTIIRQFDPDVTDEQLRILNYYLSRDLAGYGSLDPIMKDPDIEDISCNGYDLPVFVFNRAYGSLPTNIIFTKETINQFVLKLAQKANKQVSLSNPLVDATLPDGARIQITYSDVVSTRGSSFTIRRFRAEPMTPLDLVRYGTYNAETLAFLWLAIEHRKSLIVAGGTASGKTSTMNAVSLFIPQNAKIVSLEDTREIQLPHRNWLPTVTRELNIPGIKGGDIDLFTLLKASMRQRPEYIIVGEVRGAEAQTLFQAMNTGHATLSTIHAGSVGEAINRLTHDPINVPPVMFTALDLVVVQGIYTSGKTRIRRCLSIHEISVNANGQVAATPLYEWHVRTDTFRRVSETSKVLAEIAFLRGWSDEELAAELKRREEFFARALQEQPETIMDLANAIHDLGE